MNAYDGLILTFILVGIIIIFVSFVLSIRSKSQINKKIEEKENYLDDKADYEEVREKILELNEYGEYLKEELERKHKELLFMYQMIVEKQKELDLKHVSIKEVELTYEDALIEGKKKTALYEGISIDKPRPESVSGALDNMETSEKLPSQIETQIVDMKDDLGSLKKRIIELSLQGKDKKDIAKTLKIGQGQVELVLNLYK